MKIIIINNNSSSFQWTPGLNKFDPLDNHPVGLGKHYVEAYHIPFYGSCKVILRWRPLLSKMIWKVWLMSVIYSHFNACIHRCCPIDILSLLLLQWHIVVVVVTELKFVFKYKITSVFKYNNCCRRIDRVVVTVVVSRRAGIRLHRPGLRIASVHQFRLQQLVEDEGRNEPRTVGPRDVSSDSHDLQDLLEEKVLPIQGGFFKSWLNGLIVWLVRWDLLVDYGWLVRSDWLVDVQLSLIDWLIMLDWSDESIKLDWLQLIANLISNSILSFKMN